MRCDAVRVPTPFVEGASPASLYVLWMQQAAYARRRRKRKGHNGTLETDSP